MTVKASEAVATILIAIHEVWGYIFGKWGQEWTAAKQAAVEQTTANKYATARKYGSRWIGHRVADCSGLIRWVLAQFDVSVPHSSNAQWKECCKKQGKLVNGKRDDGYKLRPATLVFLCDADGNRHHVGMYVGDGLCVEAKGTRYGVVESPITRWDEWGECKHIDYSEFKNEKEGGRMEPTLRKGDRGESVRYLQELLNDHGFALAADGKFGSGTETAVKNFQQKNGLTADGIVGPATWRKIEGEGAGGETVRPDCVQMARQELFAIRQMAQDTIDRINKALEE